MERGKLYFTRLRFWFILSWVGIFLLFALTSLVGVLDENTLNIAMVTVFLLLVISGFMFYYYLGNCVAYLNKSTIVWVGLSFMSAPIGPIIAYYKLKAIAIERRWI